MTYEEAITKLVNAEFSDKYQGDQGLTTAMLKAVEALKTMAAISDKPKTNGDMIRSMTDEELAEFLDNNGIDCYMCNKNPAQCDHECCFGIVEYLKSEVSEDARTD